MEFAREEKESAMTQPVLRLSGVEKGFGGVPALLINIASGSDSDSD